MGEQDHTFISFCWNLSHIESKREFKRGYAPLGQPTIPSPDGWKGGQASNEDLFPLGYGERDRVRVRVKQNHK